MLGKDSVCNDDNTHIDKDGGGTVYRNVMQCLSTVQTIQAQASRPEESHLAASASGSAAAPLTVLLGCFCVGCGSAARAGSSGLLSASVDRPIPLPPVPHCAAASRDSLSPGSDRALPAPCAGLWRVCCAETVPTSAGCIADRAVCADSSLGACGAPPPAAVAARASRASCGGCSSTAGGAAGPSLLLRED